MTINCKDTAQRTRHIDQGRCPNGADARTRDPACPGCRALAARPGKAESLKRKLSVSEVFDAVARLEMTPEQAVDYLAPRRGPFDWVIDSGLYVGAALLLVSHFVWGWP